MNVILDRLQLVLLAMTRRSDLVIAVFIMTIIFLMILPVPTILVDALIAINMSASVVLIMVGVYLPSPLSFSAFPSVLLLTTLFRLALSITTTRLILLQADAGAIVESFGNFVVGGNMVVGLVVFLIITIVQFIVITKGSERVAEVGARFSLDAMPGKQMSIDGDMRSGVIDMETASERRGALEKESQLYGSMDGAMKFVKGDAIAGIIIIIVNILGGISIGTLQQGMDVGDAVQLYSILTVGDGLVAQIPALLIAITAGIIVTRVTVDENSNVGNDITNQVIAQPKSMLIASVMLFGFSLIPGFPTTIFIVLAIVIGGIGLTLKVDENREEELPTFGQQADHVSSGKSASEPRDAKSDLASSNLTLSVPLVIEVSDSIKSILSAAELNRELGEVRRALYRDLGVPFPGIDLIFRRDLPVGDYRILLDEVPVASGHLQTGMLLVQESNETLINMGFNATEFDRFLPDIPSLWLEDSEEQALIEASVKFMKPCQILIYHLAFVLKRYAGEFIGIQECRHLTEQMEKSFPELVKEVQRIIPVQKMTEVFSRLVAEDISIRNLRLVMQSLVEWGQTEKDPIVLTEYVRSSLKRHISYKYSGGQNIVSAYILDPAVEDVVRKGIRQTSSGSYLALEPEATASLMNSVRVAIGDISKHLGKPVVLASMDIRRYVRRLIEAEFYEVPVLSFQELTEEVTVQPLSRISL